MADAAPQFEQLDVLGGTLVFSGPVGTTPIAFPSSVSGSVSWFLAKCQRQTPPTIYFEYSIDNQVTWRRLYPSEALGHDIKGGGIFQVWMRASTAGVMAEMAVHVEPP